MGILLAVCSLSNSGGYVPKSRLKSSLLVFRRSDSSWLGHSRPSSPQFYLVLQQSLFLLDNLHFIPSFFFFFFLNFWLHWAFVAVCRLSLAAVSGGSSLVAASRLLIVVLSLVEHGL